MGEERIENSSPLARFFISVRERFVVSSEYSSAREKLRELYTKARNGDVKSRKDIFNLLEEDKSGRVKIFLGEVEREFLEKGIIITPDIFQ